MKFIDNYNKVQCKWLTSTIHNTINIMVNSNSKTLKQVILLYIRSWLPFPQGGNLVGKVTPDIFIGGKVIISGIVNLASPF